MSVLNFGMITPLGGIVLGVVINLWNQGGGVPKKSCSGKIKAHQGKTA
jgi:hypothetical protein